VSRRFFLFLIRDLFRLSRAASVAILPSALFGERLFRSVQVGRPSFSRCCYLITDLGSHLWDESWARTWAQSPELGGELGSFVSTSTPRRVPLCGCCAVVHTLLRSPTTCAAGPITCEPRQPLLASWHFSLRARPASIPSAADRCLLQMTYEARHFIHISSLFFARGIKRTGLQSLSL
jgi:hypothetical protein